MSAAVAIRPLGPEDVAWVRAAVSEAFASPRVVSRGVVHQADTLPGLGAWRGSEAVGHLTWHVEGGELEIVTLVADPRREGIGTALVRAAEVEARRRGCRRAWLVTTNDNAPAIAFYRALGWRHVATHRGAVLEARRLKPEIPERGFGGVAMEDELEFALGLAPAA